MASTFERLKAQMKENQPSTDNTTTFDRLKSQMKPSAMSPLHGAARLNALATAPTATATSGIQRLQALANPDYPLAPSRQCGKGRAVNANDIYAQNRFTLFVCRYAIYGQHKQIRR